MRGTLLKLSALLRRLFLAIGLILASFCVISVGFASTSIFGDDAELEKSTILARMNEETLIYAQDGTTLLGNFFDNAHRRYIPISEVPAHMIRALVAAEDKNFYKHSGVDIPATMGAVVEGVMNGFKFRRGASTLTQQTVKNIMGSREHSFSRKFTELVRSFKMEQKYSKDQILEFYLNQFHVTGNGNGIGIAAKYYFNKEVSQLTLIESAFIAGSVKAPSKYNPFSRVSKETQEKALAEANGRKNYVLKRMLEQEWITQAEYDSGIKTAVPFQQGSFSTQEMALVALIRSQLNRKEILEALNVENIDDLNNSGFKIYTTLDAEMQREAQLMVRRNLSRLDLILQGFKEPNAKLYKPLRGLEANQFVYGKVLSVDNKDKTPLIRLDFGLAKGTVPFEALQKTARVLSVASGRGEKFYVNELMKSIKPDDVLFVEVKSYSPGNHEAVVELAQRPLVNGGLIAVDKGDVRAVIAGFDSKGFNRAMFSTRQPGSVFKSVVFFAGLQLGWSIMDRLDNERRVFPFQGQYYFPRPEHISPYPEVSMLWAGVKSENVATISLTAQLLDKLNFEQFQELLKGMGLLPRNGESPNDYHFRVAKETGVQLDNEGIREHLLAKAIDELKPDLIFSGRIQLMKALDKMIWGRGYQNELRKLSVVKLAGVDQEDRKLRADLVRNNFSRYGMLAGKLGDDWVSIQAKVKAGGAQAVLADPALTARLESFRVLAVNEGHRSVGYFPSLVEEKLAATAGVASLDVAVPGQRLTAADIQAIWAEGNEALTIDEVQLAGILPLAYFNRIRQNLEQLYKQAMEKDDKFALERYFQHHDFRIIVGLKYLVNLSRAMGVTSPLSPVLSFGLGTNDISAAEVAKVYQSFVDGRTYTFYKEGPVNQLNFITKIIDREGKLLYETKREEARLVDSCIASQMDEILRHVVTHGSGAQAHNELLLDAKAGGDTKIRVPAYGKTGTTNDFHTAYFAGFVPYPVQAKVPLSTDNMLVIASYVGYDVNRPMRVGGFKVYGGTGALPIWTDFAKSVLKLKKYDSMVDAADLSVLARKEWPMKVNECNTLVQADLPRGTLLRDGEGTVANVEQSTEEFARNPTQAVALNLALEKTSSARNPRRFFQPFVVRNDAVNQASVPSANQKPVVPQDEDDEASPSAAGAGTAEINPTPDASQESADKPAQAPSEEPADKGYQEENLW